MRQTRDVRGPRPREATVGGIKGQWVQLGLLSASVLAPLISRWNDLRAAERARALREQAEERLKGARGLLPRTRREAQQTEEIVRQVTERVGGRLDRGAPPSSRVSSKLWLVGVGVGLAAAGVGAYILVRRQLDLNADGPLVVLPAPTPNGHAASAAGVFNGKEGAAATKPLATSPAAAPVQRTAPATADGQVSQRVEPAATSRPLEEVGTGMGSEHLGRAKFIGDTHTMLYREAEADPAALPAEEHRTYFASEAEARAAGYRRSAAEVSENEPGT